MILEEKIKISISNKKEQKKYLKKGYECNVGDMIKIDVLNLTINSHQIIKAKCFMCGTIKEMTYQTYNRITNNGNDKYYCNNKECINEKRKLSLNEKYGVDNVFQLNEIKDKIKETNLEKYGSDNPHKNIEIIKKCEITNIKKYGHKNPFGNEVIKQKIKETNLKKYGFEYVQQNKEIHQKSKNTSLKNCGFEYHAQNLDSFILIQKKQFKIKKYKNTELYYQGSYEKDFLDNFYDKVEICRGIDIEYEYLGKKCIYHPDFYLPEYNLIIEIKSTWWFKKHIERCLMKEIYTKKKYNFLLILDKNYDIFKDYIYSNQLFLTR